MDFEQITDKEKEALHIACVSESELDFVKENPIAGDRQLMLYKHDNGEVELYMFDESIILNESQIDYLLRWLSHSR